MANGVAVEAVAASAPVGNPDVIRFLEQLLEGARAGRIVGVGVGIAMVDGQWNGLAVGGGLPEVNFGLDAAKAVLLAAARGKQSPIIRPR